MPSFVSVAKRFQTLLYRESGQPFYGLIKPVEEGKIASYDFATERRMLRVTDRSVVQARDIIQDDLNQRFLVANHGESNIGDHFTYRLFLINSDLIWSRKITVKDTLTGLPKANAETPLGSVPCLVEMTGREFPDRASNLSEETRRVLTSAQLQLGDQLDDAIVRRIDTALGVTYAEIV